MAWPVDSGNAVDQWNDVGSREIPAVLAALCRAVNERREFRGMTAHEFHYTDALDVTMAYPEAADFDCRLRGACIDDVLGDLYTLVRSGSWYPDTSFTWGGAYTIDDLWDTAGDGLPAWDLSRGVLWSPNIIRLRRALDLQLYPSVGFPGEEFAGVVRREYGPPDAWQPSTLVRTYGPPWSVSVSWGNEGTPDFPGFPGSGHDAYFLWLPYGSLDFSAYTGLLYFRCGSGPSYSGTSPQVTINGNTLAPGDFTLGSGTPKYCALQSAAASMSVTGALSAPAPPALGGEFFVWSVGNFIAYLDLSSHLTDQA